MWVTPTVIRNYINKLRGQHNINKPLSYLVDLVLSEVIDGTKVRESKYWVEFEWKKNVEALLIKHKENNNE